MSEFDQAATIEILDKLEQTLMDSKKRLAELRRILLKKEIGDYTFHCHDGSEIRLSELFGSHDELIIVHNMGKSCPYCTLWADGFNGIYQHLDDRAPFAVISPDEYNIQREFARGREWKFKMLSSHGTSFFRDMGFESEKGKPYPGVSTFQKDSDGKMSRIARAYFGPGDNFCGAWHIFDLLPKGENDWQPKYEY